MTRFGWALLLLPAACLAQVQLTQNGAPVGFTLKFATIPANQSESSDLIVTNVGTANVEIVTMALSAAAGGFSATGSLTGNLGETLKPGQSDSFAINFVPTAPGNYAGTLMIETQTGAAAAYTTVSLLATAGAPVAPPLNVTIPSTDFGRVALGQSSSQTITMVNSSAAAIAVSPITVSDATDYSLQFAGSPPPLNVPAGGSAAFKVVFTPRQAHALPATLTVGTYTFPLTGSGYLAYPTPSLQLSSPSLQSRQSPGVSVQLSAPAPLDETFQLQMSFTPSAANASGDSAIQFLSGNPLNAAVTIPRGQSASETLTFQTGTTAGTILFTLTPPAGAPVTQSFTIAPELAGIDAATAVAESTQIVLSVTGFDNTHAASQLQCTFYNASGKPIPPGVITAGTTSAFAQYFAANGEAGGAFGLRIAYPVTGDVTQVAGVTFTITNPAGTTTAQTLMF